MAGEVERQLSFFLFYYCFLQQVNTSETKTYIFVVTFLLSRSRSATATAASIPHQHKPAVPEPGSGGLGDLHSWAPTRQVPLTNLEMEPALGIWPQSRSIQVSYRAI